MTIRSIALALTSAAAFVAVPGAAATTTLAAAQANSAAHLRFDAWRFVGQYRTLTACRKAGAARVASHRATAYKCEHDYTEGGAPALDLYVR